MTVIVSANYRDRSAKNWLVRNQGESIETYEVRERVVVNNFRFCESFAGEQGFGCHVVAVGESPEQEPEINRNELVKIWFNGLNFREVDTDKLISGGRMLVLDETGMYCLPA